MICPGCNEDKPPERFALNWTVTPFLRKYHPDRLNYCAKCNIAWFKELKKK